MYICFFLNVYGFVNVVEFVDLGGFVNVGCFVNVDGVVDVFVFVNVGGCVNADCELLISMACSRGLFEVPGSYSSANQFLVLGPSRDILELE